MRPTGSAAALVLTLVVGGLVTQSAVAGARADETIPSQQQVSDARAAAQAAEGDVASVEAALAAADARLEQSAVRAAQAAEEFNGARWRAQQARAADRLAAREQAAADAAFEAQAASYADAVVDSYESVPELSGLTAVLGSDDFASALDRSTTLENATDGMQARHEVYDATADRAEVASDRAAAASADARQAQADAAAARAAAQSAQDAAAAQARNVAAQRTRLIGELARLRGTSVRLAEQRQAGLEARAQAQAAAAAEQAQQAAQQAAQHGQPSRQQSRQQSRPSSLRPRRHPPRPRRHPRRRPSPPLSPPPQPAPAPSGGAQAAIAFARAQIGEPYVWAAAGPGSWDCSGLTMGAWAAGGKSLPHYSVAQYQQSTPISAGDLRPGDLVFWGSSSSSSSIYHVAIYSGDGMIIHAPRPGRGVEEVSMYYWITPNFYARP